MCRSKKGELTIGSLEIKGLLQFLIIDYSSWKDIQTTKLHLNTCYRNNYKNKFLKVSNQLLTKLTLSKAFPTTRVLPNVCKWDVMTLPKQNTQVQLKRIHNNNIVACTSEHSKSCKKLHSSWERSKIISWLVLIKLSSQSCFSLDTTHSWLDKYPLLHILITPPSPL